MAEVAVVAVPVTALDPVCGMEVAVSEATTPYSDAGGAGRQWFCRAACREAYENDPVRYAETGAGTETGAGAEAS